MLQSTLHEIIRSLPRGRTLFHYFRDRYALMLLDYVLPRPCPVSRIKQSDFAQLLTKPVIRNILKQSGRSVVTGADFQAYWPGDAQPYRLTLDQWPEFGESWDRSWHQTTLRGHNLVLQLNFSVAHNRALTQLFGEPLAYFRELIHPTAQYGELTLAWARLDLDFTTGEVLIEEIQSDWVQDKILEASYSDACDENARRWRRYVEDQLRPHARTWEEAMLAACLWFIRRELGLSQVFYHTYETGWELKNIRWTRPPRSVYSSLPRRFCFQKTHNGPLFVRDQAERRLRRQFTRPETTWYYLDLSQRLD